MNAKQQRAAKTRPSTPLPWEHAIKGPNHWICGDGAVTAFIGSKDGVYRDQTVDHQANAAYIAHAANAYPKLVAAIKMTVRDAGKRDVGQLVDLLRELGELSL